MVQGSRTYVPVMPEGEWYRAEAEQTEVFAPLVPVGTRLGRGVRAQRARAPSRRRGVPAGLARRAARHGTRPVPVDAGSVTGRRVVRMLETGGEQRDLRAVTEVHTNNAGDICVRVAAELEWYRWAWSGRPPEDARGAGARAVGRVAGPFTADTQPGTPAVLEALSPTLVAAHTRHPSFCCAWKVQLWNSIASSPTVILISAVTTADPLSTCSTSFSQVHSYGDFVLLFP